MAQLDRALSKVQFPERFGRTRRHRGEAENDRDEGHIARSDNGAWSTKLAEVERTTNGFEPPLVERDADRDRDHVGDVESDSCDRSDGDVGDRATERG